MCAHIMQGDTGGIGIEGHAGDKGEPAYPGPAQLSNSIYGK